MKLHTNQRLIAGLTRANARHLLAVPRSQYEPVSVRTTVFLARACVRGDWLPRRYVAPTRRGRAWARRASASQIRWGLSIKSQSSSTIFAMSQYGWCGRPVSFS
jgi:hypothetical protein